MSPGLTRPGPRTWGGPSQVRRPSFDDVVVRIDDDIRLRRPLDNDGQPERDEYRRGGETDLQSDAGAGGRRFVERSILDDRERLRYRSCALPGQPRHDPQGQVRDAQRG